MSTEKFDHAKATAAFRSFVNGYEAGLRVVGIDHQEELFNLVRDQIVQRCGWPPLQAANFLRVVLYVIEKRYGRTLYTPRQLDAIVALATRGELN